jgi:hypothetical protein
MSATHSATCPSCTGSVPDGARSCATCGAVLRLGAGVGAATGDQRSTPLILPGNPALSDELPSAMFSRTRIVGASLGAAALLLVVLYARSSDAPDLAANPVSPPLTIEEAAAQPSAAVAPTPEPTPVAVAAPVSPLPTDLPVASAAVPSTSESAVPSPPPSAAPRATTRAPALEAIPAVAPIPLQRTEPRTPQRVATAPQTPATTGAESARSGERAAARPVVVPPAPVPFPVDTRVSDVAIDLPQANQQPRVSSALDARAQLRGIGAVAPTRALPSAPSVRDADGGALPDADDVRAAAERVVGDVRSGRSRTADIESFFADGANHRVTLVNGPSPISAAINTVRVRFDIRITKYDGAGRPVTRVAPVTMEVMKRDALINSSGVAIGTLQKP